MKILNYNNNKYINQVNKPKNQLQIATEIVEVEKLSLDNIFVLVKEKLQQGAELVSLHCDDSWSNSVICSVLNEQLKIETMVDPHFHENLIWVKSRFDTFIDDIEIDENVKIFCTTSYTQVDMPINNQRETTIIYICNRRNFSYINFLQSIKRYRNREKIKKIILFKTKLDETDFKYKSFSDWYAIALRRAKNTLPIVNNLHKKKYKENFLKEEMAENMGLTLNKEKDRYILDKVVIKAKAYAKYSKGLLCHPQMLKKQLESEKTIHFKVSLVQRK